MAVSETRTIKWKPKRGFSKGEMADAELVASERQPGAMHMAAVLFCAQNRKFVSKQFLFFGEPPAVMIGLTKETE